MNIIVLVPCYNEALTISKVVSDFRRELPQCRIIVFDNGSTDGSAALALSAGAEVITFKRRGKGYVMQKMFEIIDADIYVVVDGDDTYDSADVHKLLEPVVHEEADMVVGRRQPVNEEAMKRINRFGNIFFSKIMSLYFGAQLQDVLSGYRVMNREFINTVPILSFEFEVETEMTLQALSKGMRIKEIPIGYRERPEGSSSKLRVLRDGYMVLSTTLTLFRDLRPLTFFGSFALFLWIAILSYGVYVYWNPRAANLFDVILITSVFIIGWLFLLIGFSLHTIDRRFAEILAVLKKRK